MKKKTFYNFFSEDEENVALALQIAEGVPEFQNTVEKYKNLCYELFPLKQFNLTFSTEYLIKLNKEHIDLSRKQIRFLSEDISIFSQAIRLDLRYNNLKVLPKSIGELKNLQCLYLGHNKLKSLLPEIGNLLELEALGLYNNQIKKLPNEISKLKKLRSLNLRQNPLPKSEIEKVQNYLPNCKVNF